MNARALLPVALLLLAGCNNSNNGQPNLPFMGLGKLPLNVLAVTSADPETGTVTYKTYVRWPGQPGAKTYEVIRTFGSNPAKVVASSGDTSFTDTSLGAGQTATFKVRALSGENQELNASDDKGVTVLAQTVGKPDGLSPQDNTSLGVGETPTLKWNGVNGANYYYVSVTRVSDGGQVFSALTKDLSIKFGDKSPLGFNNFGDLYPTGAQSSITPGIVFRWTVQAIRADGGSTPDDAKAIDVNSSATLKFSQG